MSNRNMALDVIVRLKDLLTGPLRRLRSSLDGIANTARKIGLVGGAIAAISFMGPIQQAAAFQQQLLDIAGTSNLVGQAAFAYVDQSKAKFEELALLVGQTSDTISKGAGQMIASGLDPSLVDQSIGVIGRAATSANAEFSDMSAVATSMLQTLKLPAGELESALAGLVVAGKEGAFELKDMARYFPTLTSQMAKFGVTGREAINFLGSALQIARKGTSDPAEAANNLKNFLSKILAPETVKKFAEAGVDIEAVMQDAATKGINPIEAVVQKIGKLTGVSGKEIEGLLKKAKANGLEGAEALASVREQLEKIYGAGKLGTIFGDMQVMDFLIPMLGNIDEYKRIKEEVANATGAVIDADFETQMMGLNRQLVTFNEIGAQAAREVGLAFGSWLPMINENLAALLKWLRETDAATGGMVRRALALAGAGAIAAAGIGALGLALPLIGAGLSVLATLIGPVGIAVAAIGAAGVYVYRNWASIGPRLSALWDGMKDRLTSFGDVARAFGARLISAGRDVADRYGPILRNGIVRALSDVEAGWNNLKKVVTGFAEGFDFQIDLSGLTIDGAKIAAFTALDRAIQGIGQGWQALKDFGSGFAPWLEGIGKNLGGTVNALVRMGDAFVRIAGAIGQMIGFDQSTVSGFFKGLGDLAGGSLGLAVDILNKLANALASVAEFIAKVAEAVAAGIDWASLLPDWVASSWDTLANSIKSVSELLPSISGSTRPWVGTSGQPKPVWAANQNVLPAQASQSTNVGGTINVQVTGPGQVTGVTSENSAVPIRANTGRVLGRN